jgi:hypothetical protein
MKFPFYVFILIYFINVSCTSPKELIGLWQIDKVNVGNEERTPVARWTKLQPDYTQASGNGWLQHSVGTWNYDVEQNALQIINVNGFKDEFGPFKVQIGDKNMIWTRNEEGQEVTVYLKRIEQIPTAPANQLFGTWGLSEQDTTSASEKKQAYLFFRWDQIFRQGDSDGHFQLGVYKTHGHRNEVELFHYGDPVKLERWEYELIDYATLRLKQETKDSTIIKEFQRLDFLPN